MSEKCHAFNQRGQRCDLYAGHEDDHQIVLSWTDDECWTPGQIVGNGGMTTAVYTPAAKTAAETEAEETLGPVPIYGEGRPGICVMCNHRMHALECERCDCKAGIPG